MNLITQGNITSLTSATSINRSLATATYDIQVTNQGEFVLHHRPCFSMPEKIYGGHDQFSTRCLRTFRAMNRGMAALLSGPKGCGKTLTAKKLAIDSEMPVLTITAPLSGMGFTSFLTELPNPCVIFIDEFEKVYTDKETRNSFLSLLDGASDNKHLFVLTSNDENIGEFFTNRPGRLRYHRRYTELPEEILLEIIADKMPKGKLRAAVEKLIKELGSISPDALTCLIQECLIHDEIPAEFIAFFNIETELRGAYDVTIHTFGYRAKTGISKAKTEEARYFINAVNEDGYDYAHNCYPEEEKLCVKIEEVWNARYCHAFRNDNPQKAMLRRAGVEMENDTSISANISYAEKAGSKATRNFTFQQHQIESLTRADGTVNVVLKDGSRFIFRKAQPLNYSQL